MSFLDLGTDIQYLKGVGPKLGLILARKGIGTIQDLLENFPRAYEDRRAARAIANLNVGDLVALNAQVVSVSAIPMGKSYRKMYDVLVKDGTGQIHCKFFRVPYKGYFDRFRSGQMVRIIGKVIDYRGRKEFHHPELKENSAELEQEATDEILPIYVETEGLPSSKIHKMVQVALAQLKQVQDAKINERIKSQFEKLPSWLLEKYNLITREQAIQKIHNPPVDEISEYINLKSKAHERIIFEEFFCLELFLALKKAGFKKEKAHRIHTQGGLISKLLAQLPFALTRAQLRVFEEIKKDLSSGSPMNRLVQGDVGSGKTMVVFMAIVEAFESGFQSCLMVPTEILAEQHFKNAEKLLSPLGLRVALLTGKTKTAERKKLFAELLNNEIHFLIGTHALIEGQVQFKNLALVGIDEQHRFGVEQRAKLKSKGMTPHFLILTATPIPRTLAMTAYGDLEVSVIDEMPVGRSPIQTRVTFESKKPAVWQFMLDQIEKGRQAYVIYPLVEESEKIDLKDAVSEFENLKSKFPKVRFGLLHGKMKSEEKDSVMTLFRKHEIDVLVSTTVIEVGVDVPNANIIIIEHAERFGLSQLHQLRGRVGRGEHKSFCVLVLGHAVSEEARIRTQFLESTTDGFKISEFDLEIRGPGEFMGSRQSGLSGFKLANLVRDLPILLTAREAAFEVLKRDPQLQKPENLSLKAEIVNTRGPMALAGIG